MASIDMSATGATGTRLGDDNISTSSRTITAFFDERDAAQTATDDLVAAGIPRQHIKITEGAGTTQVTEPVRATKDKSFWDELKDLFLPDEDRHSYAEGLSRGGHLLSVTVDEANYTRALDILDTDGAINIDEREAGWRAEGWTGYQDAPASSRPIQTGTQALPMTTGLAATPASPVAGADLGATDFAATGSGSASRDAGRDTTLQAYGAQTAAARRDTDIGRPKLRSYVMDAPASEDYAMPAGGSGRVDSTRIVEHMDVIASDGTKIGTVDHLDGPDRIKLAKNTSPDGQHHYLPIAWVDHIDAHVHLNKSPAEVAAGQG